MSAHLDGPPRSTLGAAMVAVRAQLAGAGYTRDPNTNPGGIEILIGERYLREEGAPPRLVMVRGTGESGANPAASPTPKRIGDGNIAQWGQSFTCYLWGAETVDDATRYDAQDVLADQVVNAVAKVMPGRAKVTTINPLLETNIVTFGEELQLVVTYTRGVPRSGAIWAVATPPQPTLDTMRPNGSTGDTETLSMTTDGSR